jgi:hypothetical protein
MRKRIEILLKIIPSKNKIIKNLKIITRNKGILEIHKTNLIHPQINIS